MRKIRDVYQTHQSELPFRLAFAAQSGHLVALRTPNEMDERLKKWAWEDLPIEPEKYGGWQYKVIHEKSTGHFQTPQERYAVIQKEIASGQYSFIVNAGDPDQEGELLIREVLGQTHCTLPVYRFWTNDLTEKAILEALRNLRDDDHDPMLCHLYQAALGRQRSDYRVGMNLSRACTLKMGARVAVGRVKTPIQAIVVRRENEIRDFKPKTVYGVVAVYAEGFRGTLVQNAEVNEEKKDEEDIGGVQEEKGAVWFDRPEDADVLIKKLSGQKAQVLSVTSKRSEQYAPKLYKLATAQIDAGKLGYDASETLAIIQRLYEKQILSYPRTGCEYLSSEVNLRELLNAAACVPELTDAVHSVSDSAISVMHASKRWINDAKLKDEGHSALSPTAKIPVWTDMDQEEQDIYRMICTRFVETFLPPLVQDASVLTSQIGDRPFRSTGKTLVSPGWTVLEHKHFTDMQIPPHHKGDVLDVSRLERSERTSTCPKRFTTADLIGVCERPEKYLNDPALKRLGRRLKIGTPATRASIIDELIRRDKYLMQAKEKKGSRETVRPTETGECIIRNLTGSPICAVDMTGDWEEQLEQIRKGTLALDAFEGQMRKDVADLVQDIRGRSMEALPGAHVSESIGICPICGGRLMQGQKQFYCSNWKEKGCQAGGFREQYGAEVTADEFLAMLQGKTIRKQVNWKGQQWEQPMRCDQNGRIVCIREETATPWRCPVCGKPIVRLTTGYACKGTDDHSCGVGLRFLVCGVRISNQDWEKLFTAGETDVIHGFLSEKKKTKFDARLSAERGADGKGTVRFAFDNKEEKGEPTAYTCPVCGKPLMRYRWRYRCDSCHFEMPRTIGKRDLSNTEINVLCTAVKDGTISGGTEALIGKEDKPTPYTCPVCGRPMVRNGLWVYCTGHHDKTCTAGVYRFLSGKVLSEQETDELIRKGKTAELDGFVSSRTGRTFQASLIFDKQHPRAEFDFGQDSGHSTSTRKTKQPASRSRKKVR